MRIAFGSSSAVPPAAPVAPSRAGSLAIDPVTKTVSCNGQRLVLSGSGANRVNQAESPFGPDGVYRFLKKLAVQLKHDKNHPNEMCEPGWVTTQALSSGRGDKMNQIQVRRLTVTLPKLNMAMKQAGCAFSVESRDREGQREYRLASSQQTASS